MAIAYPQPNLAINPETGVPFQTGPRGNRPSQYSAWNDNPSAYGDYGNQSSYPGSVDYQSENPWENPQDYREQLSSLAPTQGAGYSTEYQLDTLGRQADQSAWQADNRIGSASKTASARIGMYGGRSASDEALLGKQRINASTEARQSIYGQRNELGQGILAAGEQQKLGIQSGLHSEGIKAWAAQQASNDARQKAINAEDDKGRNFLGFRY